MDGLSDRQTDFLTDGQTEAVTERLIVWQKSNQLTDWPIAKQFDWQSDW